MARIVNCVICVYSKTYETPYKTKLMSAVVPYDEAFNSICNNINRIDKAIEDLSGICRGNQAGLQNVYDVFSKATDEGFINNFNEMTLTYKRQFKEMKEDIEEMQNTLKKS